MLFIGQIPRQQTGITRIVLSSLADAATIVAHPVSIHDIDLMTHRVSQLDGIQVIDIGGFNGKSALGGQRF